MYAHESIKNDHHQRNLFLGHQDQAAHLSPLIDHTLLKPDATVSDFRALILQALEHSFKAVCIPSSHLELASVLCSQRTSGTHRPVLCTVIGFPHGNSHTDSKVAVIDVARRHGAQEFDYVQNIAWVRERDWQRLTLEAERIVHAAQGAVVKVILETSFLNDEDIYLSALAAARGGVHILKTSTGYGSRGARATDIEILVRVVDEIEKEKGYRMGIKASGGVKTFEDAAMMVRAGATRLGTSSGISIVTGTLGVSGTSY